MNKAKARRLANSIAWVALNGLSESLDGWGEEYEDLPNLERRKIAEELDRMAQQHYNRSQEAHSEDCSKPKAEPQPDGSVLWVDPATGDYCHPPK